MNYGQFVAEVSQTPWALLDCTYYALASLLTLSPESLTPERIKAQLGDFNAQSEAYLVAQGNKRLPFEALSNGQSQGAKLVAVIPVTGVIAASAYSWWGTSPAKISRQLREAVANADVRSIVLLFNSPGGSVYGVDELASEIFAARSTKKIVAQIDPLCASAAYYLAAQCSEVAIIPSGEVGSIGVKMMWVGYQKMLEAEGIEVKHIFAGKYKVEGNPFEPLAPDAEAFMQKRVEEYYAPFVKAVARGRSAKSADVRTGMGQGRVLGAVEAKSENMVDRIATTEETIARLIGGSGAAVVGVEGSKDENGAGDGVAANAASSPILAGSKCECECEPCQNGDCTECSHEDCDCPGCTCPDHIDNSDDEDGDEPEEQASAQSSSSTNVNTAEADNKEVPIMGATASPAAAAANLNQVATNALALTQLAEQHGIPMATVTGWLQKGTTLEAAQAEVLATLQANVRPVQTASGVQVTQDAEDKIPGSLMMMRMARCVAISHKHHMSLPAAAKVLGSKKLEQGFTNGFQAATPQQGSVVVDGGAVIPEVFSSDFIPFLRPRAVVRSFGPRAYPLINGNLKLPKMTNGVIAGYIGEAQPVKVAKAQLGNVKFSVKKLGATILISNDLLRYAGISVDEQLRLDAAKGVAQTEDGAFIRSAGTEWTPKGLLYQAANKVASTITKAQIAASIAAHDTAVLAAVQNDFGALFLAIANANIPMDNMGIVISKRTEYFLKFCVRDGLGNLVLGEEMAKGTLFGVPYKSTTVIPNNLGNGYQSEAYLADFSQVVVADAPVMSVQYSQEASVVDTDGVQHNLFQDDLTGIRFIEEHDMGVLYPEAVAVLTGVEYGA